MQQQDNASKLTSATPAPVFRQEDAGANEPIFSRKKSLLTVGQYAVRQGVSAGIVQECARLGVVQVRKHRDKTFIVDLPLDIYKIIKQQDSQSPEDVDVSSCTDKITDLVNRIFQPAVTVREHGESDDILQLSPAESSFIQSHLPPSPLLLAKQERRRVGAAGHKEPDTIPDLHLFAEEQDRIETGKNTNEFAADRFRIPLLRSISESIRVVSARKLSFILMTAAVAASLFAYVWVNTDRKTQQEKLRQAYESINKLSTRYEDTRQQARLYEFDMMSWRAEAQRSKNALTNSETELQSVRRNLYEARKDLENMRQYNTEALKELNEKITKIRSHIPNAGTQPAE
jgi:hypothetical protein